MALFKIYLPSNYGLPSGKSVKEVEGDSFEVDDFGRLQIFCGEGTVAFFKDFWYFETEDEPEDQDEDCGDDEEET